MVGSGFGDWHKMRWMLERLKWLICVSNIQTFGYGIAADGQGLQSLLVCCPACHAKTAESG